MGVEWIPLGISAAGVGLSYFAAIKKARADAQLEKEKERERTNSLENKIDRVISGLDRVSKQVDDLSEDVSNLKLTVAVHDDRFSRPSLRTVSGE